VAAIWNNGGTNTITVSQSTGNGFTRSHWSTSAGGWLDSTQWMADDFNGDGKTDIGASWNSTPPDTTPEALRPGTHNVVLTLDRTRAQKSKKVYDCYLRPSADPSGVTVGWANFEVPVDAGACGADITRTAVHFNEGPLNNVPDKLIEKAILSYDEAPAAGCSLNQSQFSAGYEAIYSFPATGGAGCWKNGAGDAEVKADGCVAVVGFPTADWIEKKYPEGSPLPHTTHPDVKRIGPREWDVSRPYQLQYHGSFGAQPLPRFGFLLRGSIDSFDDLTGEDNTACGSVLSNLKLNVTYTVPPDGPVNQPR
jgi:hypothetical protein